MKKTPIEATETSPVGVEYQYCQRRGIDRNFSKDAVAASRHPVEGGKNKSTPPRSKHIRRSQDSSNALG
jgi:hypothetical protein